MPDGKPSGVQCIHLSPDYKCEIFTSHDRPAVCDAFKAEKLVCGENREDALRILTNLENSCVK